MSLLAACVVTAPSLGLLGAVWGVMDTFAGLASVRGTYTLQDMAPGISGALATAALGLLVGIPALFGHNFLIRTIRTLVRRLDLHAAELSAAIDRHHVSHGLASDEKRPRLADHAPVDPPPESAATAKPKVISARLSGELRPQPGATVAPTAEPASTPKAPAVVTPSAPTLVEDEDASGRARPLRPPGPMFPGQTKLPFEDD